MGFSEKLMTLRRRNGLSQEQLADTLGVTRQSVSKWEGGTAMPELVKLIALSELFGVTVDYLVKTIWRSRKNRGSGGMRKRLSGRRPPSSRRIPPGWSRKWTT